MIAKRPRRGMVFLVAITSLVVMLLIGVTFAAQSNQQLQNARRELDTLHALAMADAGVHYMRWAQRYSGVGNNGDTDLAIAYDLIPSSDAVGLDESRIDFMNLSSDEHGEWDNYLALPTDLSEDTQNQGGVWIFKHSAEGYVDTLGNEIPPIDAVQIVSKGTYRQRQRAVRVVLFPPAPTIWVGEEGSGEIIPPDLTIFDYALFGDHSIFAQGNLKVYGDIGSNGSVNINNNSATIDGNADAGSTITEKKEGRILGTKTQNKGAFAVMPKMDLAAYRAYAETLQATGKGIVIEGDFNPSAVADLADYQYIYVTGAVKISGNFTFPSNVTIISEEGMRISGNVSAPRPADNTVGLVLITPGDIKVTGNVSIDGIIFAHRVQEEDARVDADGIGNATIHGAILSDIVTGSGSFEIHYRRPASDMTIFPPSPPTGEWTKDATSARYEWDIASWERL